MICKNCGGEYGNDLLTCPYCNAENLAEARKQQKEYVERYNRKTKEVRQQPVKEARMAVNLVVKIAVAGGAMFLFLLILGFVVSRFSAASTLASQEKHLAKLEAYYQDGDYEGMDQYLSKVKGRHSASYEKYDRIAELHQRMKLDVEILKSDYEYGAQIDLNRQNVAENLEDVFSRLQQIRLMEEEGFVYGEEEGALYFREAYREALKTYMLLTDEEILTAEEAYGQPDTDYEELAGTALKRIAEEK